MTINNNNNKYTYQIEMVCLDLLSVFFTLETLQKLSGVLQGYNLRPLVFLLFVNDLPYVFHSDCLFFAREFKVFKTRQKMRDYVMF